MQYRTLGRTGKKVSALGFGCWAIGGNSYGPTNDRESLEAIRFAFDSGIGFYDTADIYGEGHSEQLLGEVFKESSKRLKVFIATKVGWDFYHGGTKKNFSPEYVRYACAESLKRLHTDYIDLYQLHNPSEEDIHQAGLYDVLDELKKEGKILHYGTSVHTMEEAQATIQNGKPDTLQLIFNLIDQRPVEEIFPAAVQNEIGIIAREPLACGLLAGKYGPDSKFHRNDHRNRWSREKMVKDLEKIERIRHQLSDPKKPIKQAALEFVLAHQAVSVVIPGIKTVEHVKDHLRAVENPILTQQEIENIRAVYEKGELFQTGFFRN